MGIGSAPAVRAGSPARSGKDPNAGGGGSRMIFQGFNSLQAGTGQRSSNKSSNTKQKVG